MSKDIKKSERRCRRCRRIEKKNRRRRRRKEITASLYVLTGCSSLCQASRMARVRIPLHSPIHPARLRSSRGNISCIRMAHCRGARGEFAFRSFHPVREKRRFVFLCTGLNFIIGKQARVSLSAPPSLSLSFISTFANIHTSTIVMVLFSPPSMDVFGKLWD